MRLIDISTKKHPCVFVKVDDRDYSYLNQWKWYPHKGYAKRCEYIKTNVVGVYIQKEIYMHREVLKTPKRMFSDHKNRDTLDNRRSNLRVCTKSQNSQNRIKARIKNPASKFKGVTFIPSIKKFRAQISIRINGRRIFKIITDSKSERVAAEAYNLEAVRMFGEFARVNELR